MLLDGLTDKNELVDLFTDQVEAEFAMLDVAADEPGLAEDLEVVEIEARIGRVVARVVAGPLLATSPSPRGGTAPLKTC